MIVQHFKLELINKKEPVITPGVIIKSKRPLMMRLKYN